MLVQVVCGCAGVKEFLLVLTLSWWLYEWLVLMSCLTKLTQGSPNFSLAADLNIWYFGQDCTAEAHQDHDIGARGQHTQIQSSGLSVKGNILQNWAGFASSANEMVWDLVLKAWGQIVGLWHANSALHVL